MTDPKNESADCQIVGEYVDEGEYPPNQTVHKGEVVRPQVTANYVDLWSNGDGLREFTVLLKDDRVIAIRGHSLKHSPHAVPGEDVYSIVRLADGEEVLVALFKSAEVAGIFHGEIRSGRRIA